MIYMINTTSFDILLIGEHDHYYRGHHIPIEVTEKLWFVKIRANGLVYPGVELNPGIVQ